MARKIARLELSRSQILSFRQIASSLDRRLPMGAKSLRLAAWAGLQDSMPRAALLSIHARVESAQSNCCKHSSLVQIWGPRFSNYVVAANDLAIFSLGRLPEDIHRCARAYDTASRLQSFLNGRRMPFGRAGHGMGVQPNSLRYAAPTGTILLHWDGAHQPVIWSIPPPEMEPWQARLELARRYLHVFGPATAATFAHWAGIGQAEASAAFRMLAGNLTPVRTPIGDAWILADDESEFRKTPSKPAALVRLLPSGDTYFLLWSADRELLIPETKRRAELWTTRVWPGALLVNGEIAGIWRRSASDISIQVWRRLSPVEWETVEAEARTLPLSGLKGSITIHRN